MKQFGSLTGPYNGLKGKTTFITLVATLLFSYKLFNLTKIHNKQFIIKKRIGPIKVLSNFFQVEKTKILLSWNKCFYPMLHFRFCLCLIIKNVSSEPNVSNALKNPSLSWEEGMRTANFGTGTENKNLFG